jgi:hypothetical protein
VWILATKKNFSFLYNYHEGLAKVATFAEEIVFEDPNLCMYKARQFGDIITDAILHHHNLRGYSKANYKEKLVQLKKVNILDDPLILSLELIRKKGNLAVHENFNSLKDAKKVLSEMYYLANWYVTKYHHPNHVFPNLMLGNEDLTKKQTEYHKDNVILLSTHFNREDDSVVYSLMDGYGKVIEKFRLSNVDLIPIILSSTDRLNDTLIPVARKEKWHSGYFNTIGYKFVTPTGQIKDSNEEEEIISFFDGGISWRSDYDYSDSYSYINKLGNVVLSGVRQIDGFGLNDEFLAFSTKDLSSGVIKTTGEKMAVVKDFDELFVSKDDVIIGHSSHLPNNKKGFSTYYAGLNVKGERITEPYNDMNIFSEGMAAVKDIGSNTSEANWGFVNKNGKMVIKPNYFEVGRFSNGIAIVAEKTPNRFRNFAINKDGDILFSFENCFPIKSHNSSWQKKEGYYTSFQNGLLEVKMNDKIGFINEKGRLVIPPVYDIVFRDTKWGIAIGRKSNHQDYEFIDENGEVLFTGDLSVRVCKTKIDKIGEVIKFLKRCSKFDKI